MITFKGFVAKAIVGGGAIAGLSYSEPIVIYAKSVFTDHQCSELSKLVLYEIINHNHFVKESEFKQFLIDQTDWKQKEDTYKDSFGTPFKLSYSETQLNVSSAGPDMKWETEDDISRSRRFK